MAALIQFAYGAIGWITPAEEEATRPIAISEVARKLCETGLDGVEGFGMFELLAKDSALAQDLRHARMGFSGAYASGSFVEPDRFAHEREKFVRSVEKIAELGGSTVVVGGGRVREKLREADWPVFLANIRELAQLSHARGVKFAFHPHKGTLVFTPEEIERFVRDTQDAADIIGLTLDTGHAAIGGGDVRAMFQLYHARTTHIHLKDVARKEGATGYTAEDRFVPLGAGSLPIRNVIADAWGRGYRGWMTVELDASKNAYGDAKRSLAILRQWLDELKIPHRLKT